MLYLSVPVCFLVIGAAICAPERVQSEHDPHDSQEAQDPLQEPLGHVEKRARNYNFGLGKRAYSYVSEYKRLPVYNFGLGKRSRPYSFGLGKRSIDADTSEDQPSNEIDQQNLNELFEQYDDTPAYEKRARPYSFGLGKRFVPDENEDKRGQRTYDFGLGKRLPYYDFGLGKRARSYNFGLGKRLSKFNFGLGKRERDMHRFSFGLGKRSEDAAIDDSVNYYEE